MIPRKQLESVAGAKMKERNAIFQKGERQTKRTMWFRGQYVPILYSSDRTDGFLSKSWVAKGTTQRIGAIIFATVFFCGSTALLVASILMRVQISETMKGVLGQVFGIVLAVLAFLVACFGMLLTFRLARGVVRSFHR
jgi:hypothetical protein